MAREQAAQSREQHSVFGSVAGFGCLARKNLKLVSQDEDLDVFSIGSSTGRDHGAKQQATDEIGERDQRIYLLGW
jgi:hypothetical protein